MAKLVVGDIGFEEFELSMAAVRAYLDDREYGRFFLFGRGILEPSMAIICNPQIPFRRA